MEYESLDGGFHPNRGGAGFTVDVATAAIRNHQDWMHRLAGAITASRDLFHQDARTCAAGAILPLIQGEAVPSHIRHVHRVAHFAAVEPSHNAIATGGCILPERTAECATL